MNFDERTLRESLAAYANGVVMTASDTERMQQDLNRRLANQPPGRDRRRVVFAIAAAVVIAVIVAAAIVWIRRPVTEVPASPAPQGFGPLPAITFDQDATGSNLTAWHQDNTWVNLPGARDLIHPNPSRPQLTWKEQGSSLVLMYVDAQGQSCTATKPWTMEAAGLASFQSGPQVGPVCQATSSLPSTSTWISPASDAGRKLAPNPGASMPVTQAVQLNGVWLLQGTGLLLASDETVGTDSGDYMMDDDGDIDVAPDAVGRITVRDGKITLSGTCGETVLANATTTGKQPLNSLTTTVAADPCNRFAGVKVLTWIYVL